MFYFYYEVQMHFLFMRVNLEYYSFHDSVKYFKTKKLSNKENSHWLKKKFLE